MAQRNDETENNETETQSTGDDVASRVEDHDEGDDADGENEGESDDAGALKKQLERERKRNEKLRRQITGLEARVSRRSSATKTLEDRIAALEEENKQSKRELEEHAKATTRNASIEKALEGVPAARLASARLIAAGIGVDGLDSKDPTKAIKELSDRLKAEHGFLFEPIQSDSNYRPPKPRNNGSSSTANVGMEKDGRRLL